MSKVVGKFHDEFEKSVVVDENYITAKGMGVAGPFGLALVTALFGEECAQELFRATMMQ